MLSANAHAWQLVDNYTGHPRVIGISDIGNELDDGNLADVPDRCRGNGVAHIILAVTDDGSPPLTSYRRIVVNVHP